MVTSIQISENGELKHRKMHSKGSYEDWDLLEDDMELSEETKRIIKQAEKDFKKGKFYTNEQIKKEFGL